MVFFKSAQISFLNIKCHFLKKKSNFRLHIFLSLSSHIFGVKHATELCDIPFYRFFVWVRDILITPIFKYATDDSFCRVGSHIDLYMSGENNILWDRPIINIARCHVPANSMILHFPISVQRIVCYLGLLFGES